MEYKINPPEMLIVYTSLFHEACNFCKRVTIICGTKYNVAWTHVIFLTKETF